MPIIHQKYRGFSLVELSIVVTLFAILAAFAIPSYQQMMDNARIRTANDSILSGIQIARGEAIKRNTSVQMQFRTGSAWTVCVEPVGHGDCPTTDDATTVQSRLASEGSSSSVTVTGSKGPFVFNNFGLMTSPTTATATINVSGATGSRALRIVVQKGGATRSCDPALTDVNDLRKC